MSRRKREYHQDDRPVVPGRKLSGPQVDLRYGISVMRRRWGRDPRVGLPVGVQFTPGGTLFYDEDELDRFDERRRQEAAQARQKSVAETPGIVPTVALVDDDLADTAEPGDQPAPVTPEPPPRPRITRPGSRLPS